MGAMQSRVETVRTYVKLIHSAQDGIGADVGIPVVKACDAVMAALDEMPQAQAQASSILGDPHWAGAYKLSQATKTMRDAVGAVNDACDALERAMTTGQAALERLVLPSRGDNRDETLILDRKADLTAIVQGLTGSPLDKVESVGKLLKVAIEENDSLTQYVLTNRMQFVYQANNINNGLLTYKFAQVMNDVAAATGGKVLGGPLLAMLQRGGAGTPRGVLDAARNIAYQMQQGFASWVDGLVKLGQVQGVQSQDPSFQQWLALANQSRAMWSKLANNPNAGA